MDPTISYMMEIEEGFMKIQSGYCLHFTHCSSGLIGPKAIRGVWKQKEVTVDTQDYWCLLKTAEISTPAVIVLGSGRTLLSAWTLVYTPTIDHQFDILDL